MAWNRGFRRSGDDARHERSVAPRPLRPVPATWRVLALPHPALRLALATLCLASAGLVPAVAAADDQFLDGTNPFRGPRDRRVEFRDMAATVRLDPDARAIAGDVTWTVCARTAEADLAAELDAKDLTLQQVRWVDAGGQGPDLAIPAAGAPWRWPLPGAGADTCHRLALRWTARPKRGLYFVGPDKDEPKRVPHLWTQGETQEARHWLPSPDDPDARFTWTLTVDVPAALEPLSNGDIVETKVAAGRKRRTFRMASPHPVYLLNVAAGPFTEIVHDDGRVRMSSWALPADVARARQHGDELPAILAFLEKQTGLPYPHKRYGQLWVDEFTAGGMENVTLTTLTRRALGDAGTDLDWQPDGLLAHEMAHQWFGDTVTCRAWGDLWLNEGFATYYQKLWTLQRHGLERFAEEMAGARDSAVHTDDAKPRAVVEDRFADPGDLFDAHSYARGGWVLHMLREELGHAVYDAAIAAYLRDHRFQSVETDDLRRALERASGRSLRAFFQRWVHQPGLPKLRLRARWDRSGRLDIELEQIQKVDARRPRFVLDVEIDVATTVAGAATRHVLRLDGPRATLSLPMPAPPAMVAVDPRMRLLADWKIEMDATLYEGGLHPSRHPDVRARAVAGVRGDLTNPRLLHALTQVLAHDTARHVRLAAAKALGAGVRRDVRAALQAAATKDASSHVRAAAAAALGHLHDAESLGLLASLAAKDESPMVVREALRGVFLIDRRAARSTIAVVLRRASFRDAMRLDALERLAAYGEARDLETIWQATTPGQPKALRAGALLALAALAVRVEPVRDAVRDHIEAALHEESMRLRGAAVSALAAISDPASRGALRAAAAREPFHHLADAMRKTADELGKALPAEARIRKLEEAIERIEKKLEDKKEQGGGRGPHRDGGPDGGNGQGGTTQGSSGQGSSGQGSSGQGDVARPAAGGAK